MTWETMQGQNVKAAVKKFSSSFAQEKIMFARLLSGCLCGEEFRSCPPFYKRTESSGEALPTLSELSALLL